MEKRKVIALLSALQLLCTNTFVYASIPTTKQFTGALIEQPSSSPKVRSNENNFKLLMEDVKLRQKKIEQEEKERLEKIQQEKNNKIKQMGFSRGGEIQEINLTLSFYTDLPEENSGYRTTCLGEKPRYGMVANNVLPLGTEIYIEGMGNFKVSDHGGNDFNSISRLDVLIEREPNETKYEYKKR
jgi:3D (Asp-Asp-Asp) domain-containing protein